MPFTRQQIEAIEVGTKIAFGIDGNFGPATKVVEILAKREDIHGKLFVCGYRDHGDHARISFSIKEDDATDARFYQVFPEPTYGDIQERWQNDRNAGMSD